MLLKISWAEVESRIKNSEMNRNSRQALSTMAYWDTIDSRNKTKWVETEVAVGAHELTWIDLKSISKGYFCSDFCCAWGTMMGASSSWASTSPLVPTLNTVVLFFRLGLKKKPLAWVSSAPRRSSLKLQIKHKCKDKYKYLLADSSNCSLASLPVYDLK